MSEAKVKVVFVPSGIRGEVEAGTDILSAARRLGADLDTVCGGNGVCNRCKVRLASGEFPKYGILSSPVHLSPITVEERQMLGEPRLEEGFRLGCRARLLGDAIIDIPPESQVHQQVVSKAAADLQLEPRPAVELVTMRVAEARLDTPGGDLERIAEALEFETGLTNLEFDSGIHRNLQKALRKENWTVTAAVYEGSRVIAVWPGEQTHSYGLAVDIGSTTLAGHLCDLETGSVVASAGLMNPQIRFGEDLMSRVSYSMMNPGGDLEMTAVVREGVNRLLEQLLSDAGVDRERVLDAVFVGNPVMHHLFLGIDPVELGGAPFALAIQDAVRMPARELEINLAPGARAYILPCIAGHVGADAAAAALAEGPYRQQATTLLIDVGTNAEIILGNRERLVAASSPTGPAFEGAQIEHGQRAAPGAIERVRIDRETLSPRFKVIGIEPWSDQPGFAEAVETTGVTGICGSGIIEAIGELFLAGVIRADGVIEAPEHKLSDRVELHGKTWAYRLVDGRPDKGRPRTPIYITQNDVRAIQLAKATLYASVRLLLDKLGNPAIERIRFAGAFGAHIDPLYAMLLGMIPDCPLDHVRAIGNAAGTGARIALLSRAARAEIEDQVRRLDKIETAIEPRFQQYFVEAMAIPHGVDEFPNLARMVEIPKPVVPPRSGGRRRRRRAR